MSDDITLNYWEVLYDKHWGEYVASCEKSDVHPRLGDFVVWCDEMGLSREEQYE